MTVAAHPSANPRAWTFVQSTPVSLRQFAGSKSLLPFLGADVIPGIAFPRSYERYRGSLGPRFPTLPDKGCPPAPRYCALLRLPSSIPVGPLLAPFRYLGLTRLGWCPARLAPESVRPVTASATVRQGVVGAGHPRSGFCSQGDGRLSRVPGLPFCPHAPLSDPGGVLPTCLDANRTAAFHALDNVGFGSGCPDLSYGPQLYLFRSSMTRPVFSPPLCFGHPLSEIALRFGCRPGG
jgi:hypothetical protein